MRSEFKAVIEISASQPLYEIRPDDVPVSHIDTTGFFDKFEVERAAGRLVRFFQAKGMWCKFTLMELVEFYRSNNWDPDEMLFGLSGPWYDDGLCRWMDSDQFLGRCAGGHFCVGEKFIERCRRPQS